MLIHVDYNSGDPITGQVVSQIKWMVVSGRFQPGDQLPSIRELARQLKINPTTVTRIYNELSANGVIALRQGQGAFVSAKPQKLPRKEVRSRVAKLVREMLVESLRLGMSREEIDAVVNDEFKHLS